MQQEPKSRPRHNALTQKQITESKKLLLKERDDLIKRLRVLKATIFSYFYPLKSNLEDIIYSYDRGKYLVPKPVDDLLKKINTVIYCNYNIETEYEILSSEFNAIMKEYNELLLVINKLIVSDKGNNTFIKFSAQIDACKDEKQKDKLNNVKKTIESFERNVLELKGYAEEQLNNKASSSMYKTVTSLCTSLEKYIKDYLSSILWYKVYQPKKVFENKYSFIELEKDPRNSLEQLKETKQDGDQEIQHFYELAAYTDHEVLEHYFIADENNLVGQKVQYIAYDNKKDINNSLKNFANQCGGAIFLARPKFESYEPLGEEDTANDFVRTATTVIHDVTAAIQNLHLGLFGNSIRINHPLARLKAIEKVIEEIILTSIQAFGLELYNDEQKAKRLT